MEQQLKEVNDQLLELGWEDPATEEEIAFADKIMELLIKEGKLREPGE